MKSYYKTLLDYCVLKNYLTDREVREMYSKRMVVRDNTSIIYHTIDKVVGVNKMAEIEVFCEAQVFQADALWARERISKMPYQTPPCYSRETWQEYHEYLVDTYGGK